MPAKLFFHGSSERPESLGAGHGDVALDAAGADPRAVAKAGSSSAQGERRAWPHVALALSVAGAVIGQAAGLPWPDVLVLCGLVGGLMVASVAFSGGTLRLAPPVVIPEVLRGEALLRLSPTRRLRRPLDIYVIGDDAFCRRISTSAGTRRRVAGCWIFDGSSDAAPPAALVDELTRMDELVIDGNSFNAMSERGGWNLHCKGRVRVVPAGASGAAAFSDPLGPMPRFLKRTIDLLFSVIALVLVAPALLAAILAIRLDSRGPALFRQVRVGEGGRRFTLYKLRTMTVGDEDPAVLAYMADMVRCQAQAENGMFKLGSNRRITRVGRWLRRFSIDEVPQLLNVLKGDMSLVGPRPPILEEAACYSEFHWQRLAVRPGITGLAQVSGRSRLRFDDIVALDVRYSWSWTPLLEAKILLRTPSAVLSGRGAT